VPFHMDEKPVIRSRAENLIDSNGSMSALACRALIPF
jgi:hypothetical protein